MQILFMNGLVVREPQVITAQAASAGELFQCNNC
jgi:hypothetical protein